MHIARRAILLLSLLLAGITVYADEKQPQPRTRKLSNAYYAARAWGRVDTANTKDEEKTLLGSLIWYADLQDQKGVVYGALFDALKKYPVLDSLAKLVFLDLFQVNTIFKPGPEISKEAFNKIAAGGEAKQELRDRYLKYRSLAAELNRLSDTLNELSIYDSIFTEQATMKELIGQLNLASKSDSEDSLLKVSKYKSPLLDRKLRGFPEYITSAPPDSRIANMERQRNMVDALSGQIAELKSDITNLVVDNPAQYAVFLTAINPAVKTNVRTVSALNIAEASQKFSDERQSLTLSYLTEMGSGGAFHMPSQSEMIDAVAIYLAKRMKQEAVMWFFETISKNAKRYDLVPTFFPNTIKILRNYEVYEIPNMGAQWQYALSKDFVTMPENVLNSVWLQKRCPALAPYQSFIRGGTAMATLLQDRYSYREIIARLYLDSKARPPEKGSTMLGFDKVMTLLYAVNTELFTGDTTQGYRRLKYEDYRGMSIQELEIMMSLIDMKYKGIFSEMLAGMDKSVQFNATVRPEDLRMLLGKIEQTMGRIETMRSEFAKEQKGAEKNWDFSTYNVWTSASQLWNIFDATWAGQDIFSKQLHNSRPAFGYMGELYEVYNLISKKNYAGAVNNTLKMIDSIFYSSYNNGGNRFSYAIKDVKSTLDVFGDNSLLKEVAEAMVLRKGKDSISVMGESGRLKSLEDAYGFKIDTLTKMDSSITISFKKASPMAAIVFEKDRHAIQQIRKLAGFLNDAALAQNDKQLAKAIESYALPPGSYKRKRNNWYSLDLNAYTGVYGGTEGLFQDKNTPQDFAGVIGFSAPIGLTLSKTLSRRKCKDQIDDDYILNPNKLKLNRHRLRYRSRLNVAMTLSIVDLGAVVSYRLSNTTAQALPREVNWQQLLSPGLHLAVGIPSTPLVGMIGAQITPLLREVTETQKQYNAFRIYGGLYFDLPLLNFWEKKRIVY